MILLTLGTHEQPFDRAIDLVRPLAAVEPLVIQHGHTPRRDDLEADWHAFVPREEMQALMAQASVVVCHAGVGCIMSTLALGKRPVVVPRRAALGEHVDDHQLQIAGAMEAAGMAAVWTDPAQRDHVLALGRSAPAAREDARGLHAAVAAATRGHVGARGRAAPGKTAQAGRAGHRSII